MSGTAAQQRFLFFSDFNRFTPTTKSTKNETTDNASVSCFFFGQQLTKIFAVIKSSLNGVISTEEETYEFCPFSIPSANFISRNGAPRLKFTKKYKT